ncbi:MAG: DUF4241 domain-containing protein [Proteobacteria bacterium]|nr:DUF4241 domain-containing protein [Pseudomonadota bacterium]
MPSKKHPNKRDAALTPSARVEAYIRAWHRSWRANGGDKKVSPRNAAESLVDVFEKWSSAVQKIGELHWASNCKDNSAASFGTPAEHDPSAEKVRLATISGNSAVVETVISRTYACEYNEYKLKLQKGEWRIASVVKFFDDEKEAAFDPAELEALLKKPTLRAVPPPPEAGDEPNCAVLFKPGQIVKGTLMREPQPVTVRKIGKLSVSSGTIVIRDFSYRPEDARPLSLRVPPGEYDVETCELDHTVAAVRVVFYRKRTGRFTYRRAVTVDGDGSTIGVDCGNVALCDARAYMSRGKRDHERDYEAWSRGYLESGDHLGGTFMKLGGSAAPNAVIVSSGHGDGSYPAFWVFDTKERLVALVVDFLVAAEFLTRTIRIPWKPRVSGLILDETQQGGLSVQVNRTGSVGVVVRGGNVNEIRWLDSAGMTVGSIAEVGSWNSGEEWGWGVDLAKLDKRAAEMELVIHTGFRNTK